jgi:MYXO-CTERM domain-containing protein
MNVKYAFCRMAGAFAARSLNGAALAPARGALALFLAMAGTAARAETLRINITGPDYPQSFFIDTSNGLAGSDGGFPSNAEKIMVTAGPEISTRAMMLAGLAGLALWRRRSKRFRAAA